MRRTRQQRAFTLIELVVVLATITVLTAIAVPRFEKAYTQAQTVEVITTTATIERQLVEYYSHNYQYPPTSGAQNPPNPLVAGRVTWVEDQPGWTDIAFKGDGQAYIYRYTFTTTADAQGHYTQAVIHGWADNDGNHVNGDYYIYLQDGYRIGELFIEE